MASMDEPYISWRYLDEKFSQVQDVMDVFHEAAQRSDDGNRVPADIVRRDLDVIRDRMASVMAELGRAEA